ncbi:unnamed protein product [Sympodiomycopsis kandeliae]
MPFKTSASKRKSEPPKVSEESLPQRQADEIEALTSILADDFVPAQQGNKASPWGAASQSQPFFILTIRPDDEEYRNSVWVKVEIRLPKKYPSIPLIVSTPVNPKESTCQSLSAEHLSTLGDALRKRALELASSGDEAIWEVYSCGAELLTLSNVAKEAKEEKQRKLEAQRRSDMVPSLDEEMKRREGEGAKAKAREHNRQMEAHRKQDAEKASELARVIAEREEALKAERARRRTESNQSHLLSDETNPQRFQRSSSSDTMHLDVPEIKSPDGGHSMLLAQKANASIIQEENLAGHLSKLSVSGSSLTFEPPLQKVGIPYPISEFRLIPSGQDERQALAEKYLALPCVPSGTRPCSPHVLFRIAIRSSYFSTSRGRRKLAGLERELEALAQVKHTAIRPIEGFQLQRVDATHEEGQQQPDSGQEVQDGFVLSILHPPANAQQVCLDTLLSIQPLPFPRVLSIAQQLLASLAGLHAKGLLLKDLTLDRVAIHGDAVLIDTIWCGSVGELDRANSFVDDHEVAEAWTAEWSVPELRDELRYSRKSDAYVIGRIIVLCLVGKSALQEYKSPHATLDAWLKAHGTTSPLTKFLGKLLDPLPKKRIMPTEAIGYLSSLVEGEAAGSAGSHTGATSLSLLQQGNGPVSPAATFEVGGATPPNPSTMNNIARQIAPPASRSFFSSAQPPPQALAVSRFLSDFVPLSVLGKGAFGVVSKVRNRLDGGVYAVKKIRLDSSGEDGGEEKTLREIGALARVNHPHVTRYYAAWIEETNTSTQDDLSSVASSYPTNTDTSEEVQQQRASKKGKSLDQSTSSSTDETPSEFSAATMQTQGRSYSVSFGPPKDSDFDDFDNANRDDDFLSQVGFQADEDSSDSDSDTSSDDDDDDESDSDSDNEGQDDDRKSRFNKMITSRSQKRMSSKASSRSRRSRHNQMSALAASKNASRRGSLQKPRWLYIQMELVDDLTLREVIERGPISIEDCWRLLRQILNALVHIHNLGIVHRDLKPSNILMSGPDIKIGDFGLATTLETIPASGSGANAMVSSGILQPHLDSSGKVFIEGSEDMTGEVGTALYSAPEIVKRRGARYGYKVDMYSLGIVFFEMIASGRVYSTGMERVHLLRNLRLPSADFPPAWPSNLVKEKEVVKGLVTHDPDERPSPLQLLRSELLPPRLEDESVQETLRLVTDSSSVYHLQLLDALFAPRNAADEEVRDVTFDAGSEREGGLVNPREAVVVDFLRAVFLRHGAVELVPPLLMPPRSGMYSAKDGGNPVQLLDGTGQIVNLPRDHLIPFARTIARSENHRLKRYCIGPVYRDSLLAGGQPISILAASMDIIVGAGGRMPSAAEGECLACLEEILGEIPGFKKDWVVLINHGAILDLLLERVPTKQRPATLAALTSLSSKPGNAGASARAKLMQQLDLPKSVVDELEMCAQMSDDIETAHSRLARLVPIDHRAALDKAVRAMMEVRAAAHKFGVPVERKFLLSPLLSNYSHCYRGSVFFQIARAQGGKKKRTKWDVVASGGRYTSLLARFATPLSGPPPSGVGIQIAVSKLVHALAKDQEINELKRPPDLFTPRRADVYVHSNPGMLDMRMALCRELWANGIRADLSYEDDPSGGQESLLMTGARCKEEGFSFLVYAARSIKVRNLWTNKAPEVDFQSMYELVPWLLDQLARLGNGPGNAATGYGGEAASGGLGSETQAITSSTIASASMMGSNNAGFDTSVTAPTMMETQVVLPVHSSKKADKSDRSNTADRRIKLQSHHPIINSATREAHRMANAISNGEVPVIAIDLRGDLFDNLCRALSTSSNAGAWSSSSMANSSSSYGNNSSTQSLGSNRGAISSSGGSGMNSGNFTSGSGNSFNPGSNNTFGTPGKHHHHYHHQGARKDAAWKAYLDTLGNGEEKDYVKVIKGHVEKTQSSLVMLFSIREKRAALVGTTEGT